MLIVQTTEDEFQITTSVRHGIVVTSVKGVATIRPTKGRKIVLQAGSTLDLYEKTTYFATYQKGPLKVEPRVETLSIRTLGGSVWVIGTGRNLFTARKQPKFAGSRNLRLCGGYANDEYQGCCIKIDIDGCLSIGTDIDHLTPFTDNIFAQDS